MAKLEQVSQGCRLAQITSDKWKYRRQRPAPCQGISSIEVMPMQGGLNAPSYTCVSSRKRVACALDHSIATPFMKAVNESVGQSMLRRKELSVLQVNVGLKCNQACSHCHVDSSPLRSESISQEIADHVVHLLKKSREGGKSKSVATLDLTGGAPELNKYFRFLVKEARALGIEVIDRCNLTILHEPEQEDLAHFLAENGVRIIASLPCYSEGNVDKQRGHGVFEKSIAALKTLNSMGYGMPNSTLVLDLVYNPIGPLLPPPQPALEESYKEELRKKFGIEFNSLFTITNMPIKRFADQLLREGYLEEYMRTLVEAFNPLAVEGIMCRSYISVGYDGSLYDCDFNQQLGIGLKSGSRNIMDVQNLDQLLDTEIATAVHCYGCTAGAGSSCQGTITA